MKQIIAALLFLGTFIPHVSYAQDYPAKQVTIVVPFSPGAVNDLVARYLADHLGKLWKQTVIVENRPGGGSSVGAAHVARSAPDGYKLLIGSSSYTTLAAMRTDLGYDPIKDLKPVSMVAVSKIAVITGSRVPMPTLADLAREAKARTILYATAGVGSSQHFNGELLNESMGIKMKPVPYPGGAEGITELLAGRIDVLVGGINGVMSAVESGAKAIAVLSKTRSSTLPNVPTIVEAGYPQAVTQQYWAIFLPAGTPESVAAKINEDVKKLTNSPEGRAFLAKFDAEPTELNVGDVTAYVKDEISSWTALAKQLNLEKQ